MPRRVTVRALFFPLERTGPHLLFSADQVFWGGAILLQNVPDASIQDCAASMEKLLTYEFDALIPSHLNFSLEHGKRHVEAASRAFEQTGLPRNLFS